MQKLKIEVELSDHLYHAFEFESQRKGEKMEEMVARMVNVLIVEMEREEERPPVLLS